MNRRSFLATGSALFAPALKGAQKGTQKNALAIPSIRQLRRQRMDLTAFLHFTVNTFTDREWGLGDEDPNIFHPTALDADGIVRTLKECGFKGVILTCKHHDGFCLWPTKTTEHSIEHSSWRGGKGDVVREFADAAKRHEMPFGVYLSPWDRNSALYGKPEYIGMYRRQLTELLTGYGPIYEVWHDGANGGDGYYGGAREKRTIDKKTYYDWPRTWQLVRKLQPEAVIFSDVGPDFRWVGNENGIAGDPCWATYDPVSADGGPAAPGDVNEKLSPTGTLHGSHWMPAECDVSIRPGWFWHAAENDKVKTPKELFDLYLKSYGRGASLLLNIPPNREGRLQPEDVAALRGFHDLRKVFAEPKATARLVLNADEVVYALPSERRFNLIRLREEIASGQRIESVEIDKKSPGGWTPLTKVTSVGACRIVQLDRVESTDGLRARIRPSGKLSELSVFYSAG